MTFIYALALLYALWLLYILVMGLYRAKQCLVVRAVVRVLCAPKFVALMRDPIPTRRRASSPVGGGGSALAYRAR